MKALRTVSARTMEIVDIPAPEVLPGEVLVDIHTVTLCGTDIHIWEDHYATELPIIQGHEISATIAQAEPGAVDAEGVPLAVGDPVVIHPLLPCGVCPPCRQGRENACTQLSVLGCYTDGGFVEQLALPANRVLRVPEGLDLRTAALVEPVSIAYHAVRRARPQEGERAVVFGCGAIGLIAIRALKDRGCEVLAIDTVPARTITARRCGADETVVVGPERPAREAIAEWAEPWGPEIIVEATGVPQCLEDAVHAIACTGRIVCVGISERPAQIPLRSLPTKEIEILGSRNCQGGLGEPLRFVARYRDLLRELITHEVGLPGVSAALQLMADRAVGVGKIAVDVRSSLATPLRVALDDAPTEEDLYAAL
ncbi:alcohol dehydrogenase catalytic domain-containing protein [Corynebacterium uropygiale]|uniref:Alcohol dehydrogenase catalytic domain-containing protein n=1 Tax=Corynebacterium uropygiale TaxID=1775911 RepID=A0A9X1QQX8_9CORY|nr:alcohol dehydrogenase catalytic domain-containing protein [Corynebacterium uropygiale]MCF4007496.1 alcohol dehydrogenase catalytic domain-containing protein [Corynebacterium uropygiale]